MQAGGGAGGSCGGGADDSGGGSGGAVVIGNASEPVTVASLGKVVREQFSSATTRRQHVTQQARSQKPAAAHQSVRQHAVGKEAQGG